MKNTFVKVLSFVMALMMVVGTFSTLAVFAADEHVHTKGELVETKAPTCKEFGFTTYLCGECGEEWSTDPVAPSAEYHAYEDKEAQAATCMQNAKEAAKVCKYCEKTPDGKDWPEVEGTRLLHNIVGKYTAATCDAAAKTEYSCTICGLTVAKIAEKNGFADEAQAAKFLSGAWNTVYGTRDDEQAKNPGHTELTWKIVVAPVNCQKGLAEGYCEYCKTVVRTSEIPEIHNPVEVNPKNHACAQYPAGVEVCKDCGKVLTADAKENEKYGKHEKTTAVCDYGTVIDAANLPEKPVTGETFTIAELKEFGFNVGDKIGVAPTCTTEGNMLVQCECGEIFIKTVAKSDHRYTASYEYKAPTNCTEAYTKVRTCANAGCDHKDIVVVKAAANTAHNMVVVPSNSDAANKSVDATCVSIGYTYRECTNKDCMGNACGTSEKINYVDALGHTYGDPYFKANQTGVNCTTGVWEKKCVTCDGKLDGGVVVVTAENTKDWKAPECKWGEKVTVAATCAAVAYEYVPCTVCGAKKDIKDVEGSKKDATNHVYPEIDTIAKVLALVAEGKAEWVANTASTCKTAGQVILHCTNPDCADVDTTKVATAPLAEHTWLENVSKVEWNDNGTFKSANYDQINATCKAVGYKANGKICKICQKVDKAPEQIAINPNAHTLVSKINTFDATCQAAGYETWNTSCGHGVVKVLTGDGKPVACKYTKDDGSDNVIAYQAPTCLEDGHHAYVGCVWCKSYKQNGMVQDIEACGCKANPTEADKTNHKDLALVENYTIAALGHDFSVEVKKVEETCDKPGTEKYFTCKNGCGYAKYGDKVYSTSDADKKALALDIAIAPHYGQYKQFFKAAAATCTSKEIVEGTYCTKCQKDTWFTGETLPHDYEYFYVNYPGVSANYDCTQDYCLVIRCTVCGKTEVDYEPATKTAHEYASDWTLLEPATNELCYKDTIQYKKCKNCDARIEEVKTKATGHYTTDGIEGGAKTYFDLNCNKISDFFGKKCDVCKITVSEASILSGHYVVKHNVVKIQEAETCTTDGINVNFCKNCNYTDNSALLDYAYNVNETIDEIDGHTIGNVLEDTDTYTKYMCSVCGAEFTVAKEVAVNLDVVTDATVVAAGSTVTVTVNATVSTLTFSQLFVNVNTNGAFEITDVKLVAAFEGANVHADQTKSGFVLYTENSAAGEPVFATLSGEDVALVTLTLTAAQFANGEYAVTAVADKALVGFDEEGEEDIIRLQGKSEKATLTVTNLGDLNGDSIIGVSDIQALIPTVTAAVAAGTYNANADLNKDGAVDQFDVAAIRLFMKKGFTAAAYIEMIGEDLDAAIASLKITDVADAILFEAYVNEQLTVNYADYLEALEYFGNLEGIVKALYLEMHA